MGLLAGGLAAACGAMPAGSAQELDLRGLPQPVSVLRLDRPIASVEFAGDYGPVRVTGTLTGAPGAAVRLNDRGGRLRDVAWREIRTVSRVDEPAEGFPIGSYQVTLLGDPVALNRVQNAGLARLYDADRISDWRALQVPSGSLKLEGASYGSLTIPLERVSRFELEPVRGNITGMPAGVVRMELFNGAAVAVPLQDLQWLQRDVAAGTVTITLADQQSFTGKLVSLPAGSLELEPIDGGPKQLIPLDQIGVMERSISIRR